MTDLSQAPDTVRGSAATAVPLSPTSRSTVRRGAKRAQTERAQLYELLDSCLICHFGIVRDGAPVILPTGYGRSGDTLYLHGSTGSASLVAASGGAPISVAVTRLDGVVYARSVFHHSMNYASAVIHGVPRVVDDPDEKVEALRLLTEHIAPGSWSNTRLPTRKELAATSVIAVSLREAAVKMRSGPPGDDDEDLVTHREWAGVLPLHLAWGEPEPCPLLPAGAPVPERVAMRAPLDAAGR
ncbi:pyridoxamine 5'-phosphate oxidase family protein [Phytoactinopolyspora alkaliphila]|uniref:Pyridoxamine 5'-phosphate oxidase family protein n=1 Tax=Phytoactinopolyspora alkaliphila TaxID=1783498 RepID=A0A6N9YG31_9ACTN|nr:pyridoxamine 5'-phosphate oxidase family protein [Phytoactinopolyspora alkaliphila]NED93887.1 pyridoxamine 5'-phosphate oxidase family protein [Phytoactinopolyspora alkaliphila]